jgi:hypothetical protein
MKPHVLRNIQIDFQWPEIANAVREDLGNGKPYLGEIEPQAAGNNDPLIAKLLDVGQECGLTFKKQSWYTGNAYLPIRGSVPWHSDSGIGLLLNWLVMSADLEGYKDCLIGEECKLLFHAHTLATWLLSLSARDHDGEDKGPCDYQWL